MVTRFYGADVVDFSIKGGFGQDISLDINLVLPYFAYEASTNPVVSSGFVPPPLGSPALFKHEDWEFYGIFDTYKRDEGSGGNPLFSTQLTNGQFILGGVEIILNDYYGSVGYVPNLINLFGLLENSGGPGYQYWNQGTFGFSRVNSAGIQWDIIASGVTQICNTPGGVVHSGTPFGNGITYKGHQYRLDLSDIPMIPSYYRINNDSINLLDFVSDVCSAGGHDYFFQLVKPTDYERDVDGFSGTFKLKTISRIDEPSPGRIADFINNSDCVTSSNYGQEIRKDVHSKFVVGASLERLYFNYPQTSGDNSFDGGYIDSTEYGNDTILPFFGTDVDNNVIIGYTPEGEPNEYYFNIDIADIDIPDSNGEYLLCLGELKAARKGRESWERYLCTRDANQYIIESDGASTAYFKTSINFGSTFSAGGGLYYFPKYGFTEAARLKGGAYASGLYTGSKILQYNHNGNLNEKYQAASKLKLSNGQRLTYPRTMEDDLYTKSTVDDTMLLIYNTFKSTLGVTDSEFGRLSGENLQRASRLEDESLGNFNDNKTDQLFRRIKGIADTYYNKKFMVSIPFTFATFEPESMNIRMSQDVINEGYLDESAWSIAYASGLIPDISGINTLLTPDNKFYPFAKYENCVVLDSGGNVTSMLYDFSEVGSDDKIFNTPVSSGSSLVYDCWVKCRVDEKIYFQDTQTLYGPRAVIELPGSIKKNKTTDYPTYMKGLMGAHALATGVGGVFYGDASVTSASLKASFDKIGGDDALYHDGEDIQYANLYAVPLRSKLLCYGPWYAIGADGKVSYERNEELNPWNYGGFDNMNVAGFARVNDGITNQTFSEVGSLTVVGAPTLNFGDIIVSGGPYVTDISCSFGSNGITTTYNFQAWSSHRTLSKLQGYAIERNKRINHTLSEIKSNFREGIKNGRFKNAGDFFNKVSNRFIDLNDYTRKERSSTSHKMFGAEINGTNTIVVTQPVYNASSQAWTRYEDKAFMSMDGLLSPFSTVEKSGWPSFILPETSGEVDVYSINPFPYGHSIIAMSYGSGVQHNGLLRDSGEVPYSGDSVVPYRALGLRLPAVGVGWGFDINGEPVPAGTGVNGFTEDYLYNVANHKAGPIDLRWDEDRGVWGSVPTSIYLAKLTNLYTPACFSFEVNRATSRAQYARNAPSNKLLFNTTGTIHDPEAIAYTGNELNIGCYEQLDYSNIEYPYYEAFIIRKTSEDSSVKDADYNIWYEDCSDCGHISNECSSHTKHGSPSAKKKILIENPLRQSFDVGDLAFTVDTGKKKKVSGSTFIGGSGIHGSGHFLVDAGGNMSFVIDSAGSDYSYGAFAVYSKPCVGLTLTTTGGSITGSSISGTTSGVVPTGVFPVSIYPKNASAEYEMLPIHWVLQAEFKSKQFVTHVECDNGILQTCTIKGQLQGFSSCEHCGENTSLINNFI